MVDKATLWPDLTGQLVGWIKSNFTPNLGDKMFATGFGGPNKENESMSPAEFFAVRDSWKGLGATVADLCLNLGHTIALGKGESLGFAVNQSNSGYTSSSTCDLVASLTFTEMKGKWPSSTVRRTFAYHINVPGIKECGGPQFGKVPVETTETVPTTTTSNQG